jgi:hypothetical protein
MRIAKQTPPLAIAFALGWSTTYSQREHRANEKGEGENRIK